MPDKQLIASKPAYEQGQLLMAGDFIAEQGFHEDAQRRHSLALHGTGVVRGLEVLRKSESTIEVGAGHAIDRKGREIEWSRSETLELQGLPQNSRVVVTLGWRTEKRQKSADGSPRIDCFAVLRISSGIGENDIVLATLQTDSRGRLGEDGVSPDGRTRLQTPIAEGSVTVAALEDRLRTGWLRSPFRATPIPKDQSDAQPPFRVGSTETVVHREIDGQANTRGAGGTMAIALPPQAIRALRLRIAGTANEKKMRVELYRGGWDAEKKKHVKVLLLQHEIGSGAYDETWEIPKALRDLQPDCSTLSLEVRTEGYARVSLVAVELSCSAT